jgi:hypothetical protein
MNQAMRVQGRTLTPGHIAFIHQLIVDHPSWSRRKLSIALSTQWDWRNAKGDLKDMACRSLLLKLNERHLIELPPRRQTPTNRMTTRQIVDIAHDTAPIQQPLSALRPLRIIDVHSQPHYEPLFSCLLAHYHYLGYTSAVGENMKYLVVDRDNRPLACLLFGSAAWSCNSRDVHIGWSRADREQHLQFITNNTRFLILPWVRVPHLASHVLALVSRRIYQDWLSRYAHPVYVLETFVDQSRFTGTCYRAANWQAVGQTRGRSRNDRRTRLQVGVKSVFVYPLVADYQTRLTSPSLPAS